MSDTAFATLGSRYSDRWHHSPRVHVVGERRDDIDPGTSFAMGYISHTLCGRPIYQYRGGGLVGGFNDDELCRTCYKAYDGDKAELFQHPMWADS